MSVEDVWRAFERVHEGPVPSDSNALELAFDDRHEPADVAAALIDESRRHRVDLPLRLMRRLCRPDPGCPRCHGTAAEPVGPWGESLCRCCGGEYGRTWLVEEAPTPPASPPPPPRAIPPPTSPGPSP